MPKESLTSGLLRTMAGHLSVGRVDRMKITRYKSGQKKGQLYVDYSLNDKTFEELLSARNLSMHRRKDASLVLKKAAQMVDNEELKDIHFSMVSDTVFIHQLVSKK